MGSILWKNGSPSFGVEANSGEIIGGEEHAEMSAEE